MKKIFEVASAEDFLALPVEARGESDWLEVTQDLIDKFADTTGDHQWIHVDQARARAEMPDGKTIAHGYLLMSLTPQLLDQAFTVTNCRQSLNYGLEKVRFISPVPSGSRVKLVVERGSIDQRLNGIRVELDCQLVIENYDRPALVFRQIALFVF
jgi:acyl dehydratase